MDRQRTEGDSQVWNFKELQSHGRLQPENILQGDISENAQGEAETWKYENQTNKIKKAYDKNG